MRLFKLLESSKELNNLDDLNNVFVNLGKKQKKPIYILVAGSVGSGKSFIVDTFNKKYNVGLNIIDPDNYTLALGNGIYDEKNVAKSMAMVKKEVKEKLLSKESFLQQGTSANLQASINKLKEAKKNGFITILLYVIAPIEQTVKQIETRVKSGGRGSTIDRKKIENTYNGARLTFRTLTGQGFGNISNDDLERVTNAIEKTKSLDKSFDEHIKEIRNTLDYYIRIDNEYQM